MSMMQNKWTNKNKNRMDDGSRASSNDTILLYLYLPETLHADHPLLFEILFSWFPWHCTLCWSYPTSVTTAFFVFLPLLDSFIALSLKCVYFSPLLFCMHTVSHITSNASKCPWHPIFLSWSKYVPTFCSFLTSC